MSVFDHVDTPYEAKRRQHFHDWCDQKGIDRKLWIDGRSASGYHEMRTQDLWEGFKAAYDLTTATPDTTTINAAIDQSSPYWNPQNKAEMKIQWLRRTDAINMVRHLYRTRWDTK